MSLVLSATRSKGADPQTSAWRAFNASNATMRLNDIGLRPLSHPPELEPSQGIPAVDVLAWELRDALSPEGGAGPAVTGPRFADPHDLRWRMSATFQREFLQTSRSGCASRPSRAQSV